MRKYLSFQEKLTQIWLSQILVVMALLILKVYFFTRALISAISAISEGSVSTCTKLNLVLDQLLNTLYQMSQTSQYAVQYAMQVWVQLVQMLLSLSIKITKGVIGLLIELYLGTFTCLCTAFVRGTLDLVSEVISSITELVQEAINGAMKAVDSALSKLSLVINGLITSFEAIKSFFSGDSSSVSDAMDSVSLSVGSLTNITIPTTFVDEISDLANSIPDFSDVLSNITSIVTLPLDVLDSHVSLLSVPEFSILARNQSYNVFGARCTEIKSTFAKLEKSTQTCSLYILIGLGAATLLVLCFLVWWTRRDSVRTQNLLQRLALEHLHIQIGNLLYQYDNRILSRVTESLDPRLQWLVSYTNTASLLRCVLIGLGGLLLFGLQSVVLNIIDRGSSRFLALSSDTEATQAHLLTMLGTWTNETSAYIETVQNSVNQNILAPIQQLSDELLSAILDVESTANDTINTIFGNTPFASPLRTIIYCTIGRKLDTIEAGLTWLVDNTELNVTSYSDPHITQAALDSVQQVSAEITDLSNDIYLAIQNLVEKYRGILQSELIVACVFVGIWVAMFVVGCSILAVRSMKTEIQPQEIGFPQQIDSAQARQLGYPFKDPFGAGSSIYSDILK